MSNDIVCEYCDDDDPELLDRHGEPCSESGLPGCWKHVDPDADNWWVCPRKAAEEHAELEHLRRESAKKAKR